MFLGRAGRALAHRPALPRGEGAPDAHAPGQLPGSCAHGALRNVRFGWGHPDSGALPFWACPGIPAHTATGRGERRLDVGASLGFVHTVMVPANGPEHCKRQSTGGAEVRGETLARCDKEATLWLILTACIAHKAQFDGQESGGRHREVASLLQKHPHKPCFYHKGTTWQPVQTASSHINLTTSAQEARETLLCMGRDEARGCSLLRRKARLAEAGAVL